MTANGSTRLGEVEYADLVSRVRASVAGRDPAERVGARDQQGRPRASRPVGRRRGPLSPGRRGGYAGHHPHDSDAAIAEIEELRRRGAEYLVIPATARWWLDHYEDFARHLATHGDLIADDPDSCLIYRLGKGGRDAAVLSSTVAPCVSIEQMRDFLENLIEADAELAVLEANGGFASALAPLHAVSVRR